MRLILETWRYILIVSKEAAILSRSECSEVGILVNHTLQAAIKIVVATHHALPDKHTPDKPSWQRPGCKLEHWTRLPAPEQCSCLPMLLLWQEHETQDLKEYGTYGSFFTSFIGHIYFQMHVKLIHSWPMNNCKYMYTVEPLYSTIGGVHKM